jgi:Carboxypeptidase regulatory-like domain
LPKLCTAASSPTPSRAGRPARAWPPDEHRLLSQELSNVGGIVHDAGGSPVAGAWVTLAELGKVATAGDDGRFRLTRVPTGSHEVRVRDREGREATVEVRVPSEPVDVVLGARVNPG